MLIRPENTADAPAIRDLVTVAFRDVVYSSGMEAGIVDALRDGGALTLSLVAIKSAAIVGHVTFSPVTIASSAPGWFGLGPVAVQRDYRRQGIGRRLIEAGLDDLRKREASGCVVRGDPAYYVRFGFEPDPVLFLAGVSPGYFQQLRFRGEQPSGEVRYHPAFGSV